MLTPGTNSKNNRLVSLAGLRVPVTFACWPIPGQPAEIKLSIFFYLQKCVVFINICHCKSQHAAKLISPFLSFRLFLMT